MKRWMHKVELLVDRSIAWLLILLLLIIIVDFFFKEIAEKYRTIILLLDSFVIFVFVLDLIFKYIRAKNIPDFLKSSWLDIIAVFPFALFFRAIEGVVDLFASPEVIREGQRIIHEGLRLEEESSKLVKEIEGTGKISRTRIFSKIFKPELLRPLTRTPRFVKAIHFFEKPTGNHHIHEK